MIKRILSLLGLCFVQTQAVAQGVLPVPPGVPASAAEWGTFFGYLVLTVLMHIPKIKAWFAASKAAKAPQPVEDGQEAEPLP